MNYISYYFVYFLVISVIGWIYETLLTIFTKGRWENRGFLFGPLCPIYGTGAVLGTLAFTFWLKNISWWQVFIVGLIGSAILELVVSITLEKLFHAVWWDYSDMPLNFEGRISLPTACCFGIAALLIVYVINPKVLSILDKINELDLYLITLLNVSIISIDTAITVCALSDFEERVSRFENRIDTRMESVISTAVEIKNDFKQAIDEAREEITEDVILELSGNMHILNKNAISRISRFTQRKNKINHQLLNDIKNKIKQKKVEKNER